VNETVSDEACEDQWGVCMSALCCECKLTPLYGGVDGVGCKFEHRNIKAQSFKNHQTIAWTSLIFLPRAIKLFNHKKSVQKLRCLDIHAE